MTCGDPAGGSSSLWYITDNGRLCLSCALRHSTEPPVCVCDHPTPNGIGECQACYRPYRKGLLALRREWRTHLRSFDVTGGTASNPAAGLPPPAATPSADADPLRRAATRRAGIVRGRQSPRHH